MQCFAVGGRIAAETAERAEREGKVLDDVKCQMCGFLVEDIWSLMVQRSVMDADPINVDRETTQWLVSTNALADLSLRASCVFTPNRRRWGSS